MISAVKFTDQVSSLRPALKTFTYKFTNNKEESQDLVQDTILKALIYRDKFREDTNLKGWLFTIMRNTFINDYRKNQRAKTSRDYTKDLHFLNVEDKHTFNEPAANFEYHNMWDHINSLRDELL